MPEPSLSSAAAELRAELRPEYDDADELAAAIASELVMIRPDTTAEGRRRAAYRAVGLEPPTADAPETKPRQPVIRKATAKRTARRTGRAARQLAGAQRTASIGGLLFMTLALVLLYQLLTTADRLSGLFGSLQRAVQWLDDPYAPIGGRTQ